MRIKLRLYARDLDLLTLKQLPNFHLGSAIRQALYEYAETGSCERIHIQVSEKPPIELKKDVLDISFENKKYEKVVSWLTNIRPGMRSTAIKSVFRSAIENPILFAFECSSNLVIKDAEMVAAATESMNKEKSLSKSETKKAENKINVQSKQQSSQEKFVQLERSVVQQQIAPAMKPVAATPTDDNTVDDINFLFEEDWMDNY